MIGYTLKSVLELVPEALPLVKQAKIEEDYPVDSRDSCLASALSVAYKTHITGERLEYDTLVKVANAVTAYGLSPKVSELSSLMIDKKAAMIEKKASIESPDSYLVKEANWTGDLSGFNDIEASVREAEDLLEKAASLEIEPSTDVKIYGGKGFLVKQAALDALGSRFHATKKDTFIKIAAALSKEAEVMPASKLVQDLCKTVTKLDKEAGLHMKGFNFYKESLLEKEAAISQMNVCVAGNTYPLNKVLNLPSNYVDDYLGKSFMSELNSDPSSAKAMVESLPMDTQSVLGTILKNA